LLAPRRQIQGHGVSLLGKQPRGASRREKNRNISVLAAKNGPDHSRIRDLAASNWGSTSGTPKFLDNKAGCSLPISHGKRPFETRSNVGNSARHD